MPIERAETNEHQNAIAAYKRNERRQQLHKGAGTMGASHCRDS